MACGFSLSHERSQIERKGERERRKYIFSSKVPDLYYKYFVQYLLELEVNMQILNEQRKIRKSNELYNEAFCVHIF